MNAKPSYLWFCLGLCVFPFTAALLWLLMRVGCDRRARTSPLPSGQYDEPTLDSARLAMSFVRPKLQRPLTEPLWDAGFDVLAGLDSAGTRWVNSCGSSIGSHEADNELPINPVEQQGCCSSCHPGGEESGTPTTHESTCATDSKRSNRSDGSRGAVSNHLCADSRWMTCGEGWPD